MKKFSVLLGGLLVLSFLACSSKDDSPSESEIAKKPSSLFVETSEGYSWIYQFSYSDSLITKLTSSAVGGTTEFEYDSNNRLVRLKGNSGRITYSYTDGKLSSMQFKDNRDYTRTTYFFYNSLDQISKTITDENGRETSDDYVYDSVGRLSESISEFGSLEKYRYDNLNNIFKNVYPQMGPKHNFDWISPLTNNVISHERSSADNLRYQYVYDTDNYPILVKELGSNGEVNMTTTITYLQ